MIHAPSIAIGSIITAMVLIAVFYGMDRFFEQPELELVPTPSIQQEGPAKITLKTFIENGSPILGSKDAQITLVEFGDYQCHFCNVFYHSTEEQILENYIKTGKVKMIFKDYNIIGPDSINASHGAHCAEEQGLFWEYHDILYDNWTGENNGWASSENLVRFAQEIEVNMEDWTKCMNDRTYSQKIISSNDDARSLEISGTPAFFVINTEGKVTPIFGAQPYSSFERIFEEQLNN
ncbi:MAG: DsbA family protein [Nitrosopumilus sp.]